MKAEYGSNKAATLQSSYSLVSEVPDLPQAELEKLIRALETGNVPKEFDALGDLNEDHRLQFLEYVATIHKARTMDNIDELHTAGSADQSVEVPLTTAFLLCFFLPKKQREAMLGDLEEEYRWFVERFGVKRAKLWFYKQVVVSLWPLFGARVSKAAANFVGLVWAEYTRRGIK